MAACGGQPDVTPPGVAATFALPTAPPEAYLTEDPPETIPPGFDFLVPAPLTAGNADIYAQRALFLRTGSMCFAHVDVDGSYRGDFNGMAAKLETDEGLLEDGRTYVGPLVKALRALDLELIGVEAGDVAYGIGRVIHRRAIAATPARVGLDTTASARRPGRRPNRLDLERRMDRRGRR